MSVALPEDVQYRIVQIILAEDNESRFVITTLTLVSS